MSLRSGKLPFLAAKMNFFTIREQEPIGESGLRLIVPKSSWRKCGVTQYCLPSDLLEERFWTADGARDGGIIFLQSKLSYSASEPLLEPIAAAFSSTPCNRTY
jgi:hypothetical protein